MTFVSEYILELSLRFPPGTNFNFLPGQYVTVIRNSIKRKYSIAGRNTEGHLLFFIKKYTNGKLSKYFFNEMKKNDLLYLEGPAGSFYYHNNNVSCSIFLATGTGVAPIKAILDDLEDDPSKLNNKEFHLFIGARKTGDLFWKPHYRNIKVNVYLCLSQSDEVGCHSGYVQDVLLASALNIANSDVYACGSLEMIRDAKAKLLNTGLNTKYFYSDAFVSTNDK